MIFCSATFMASRAADLGRERIDGKGKRQGKAGSMQQFWTDEDALPHKLG
jgi:hypothetical protein